MGAGFPGGILPGGAGVGEGAGAGSILSVAGFNPITSIAGGIGIIPGRAGPITNLVRKAITGGKVDRGIGVNKFDFRSGDIGGLGAFEDLFVNNLAYDETLDLSSFRSAGGILQERRGGIGEAASIVLRSLDKLGLTADANDLRALQKHVGTPTGSHNTEFANLQSLWDGSLEGERLVQQVLSGMSESDQASFNKGRDSAIAGYLLRRYERQIQGEIDVINDSLPKEESGFYRPGSINVNDLLSDDTAIRDKTIAAIKNAGNYALIKDKVEHLPTMLDSVSEFESTLNQPPQRTPGGDDCPVDAPYYDWVLGECTNDPLSDGVSPGFPGGETPEGPPELPWGPQGPAINPPLETVETMAPAINPPFETRLTPEGPQAPAENPPFEQCPPGSHSDGQGGCIPNTLECPEGMELDASGENCVPIDQGPTIIGPPPVIPPEGPPSTPPVIVPPGGPTAVGPGPTVPRQCPAGTSGVWPVCIPDEEPTLRIGGGGGGFKPLGEIKRHVSTTSIPRRAVPLSAQVAVPRTRVVVPEVARNREFVAFPQTNDSLL